MQIIGDDFVKKVQLKQEKEELEKKLSELDETRISMGNINLTNNLNNAYKGIDNNDDMNEMNRLQQNINYDDSNEFDNIMLNQQQGGEDNKKKYLILGIVLVVLFLLTIIIIRLLTGDSKKEDPFTSNSQSSSEMKTLSENSGNIEDRYQRILDDKAKKDSIEPSTNQQINSSNDRLDMIKETKEDAKMAQNENFSDNSIPNEALDETIKKIEEKKQISKTSETNVAPSTKTQAEPKKSIRDLVEGNSGAKSTNQETIGSGYFIQIGAFSKRPSESYLKNITSQGFKYKVIQEDVKGSTFNKLLIGPYSSRATASNDVSSVKNKLNIQNTFIVNY
ncbi:SPOR domain-containing protein [Aliarcobacter cryaerophilus]|uniref:SPOR domain-containing protein n=1 Tax=Aliarcobacter cryaerophilus TaxID=28198 RepID=A0A2S9SUY5_9BACT|nr:SPOR domain-containing protein [Aliarcobacter cryaerophilus]PRM90416.1 SPOR domain-containing protein [Aliarcobacter cryaerophilus]